MPELSILRPGMFTTVQDLGRWGFQACGVPVCGVMDHASHRRANRIVGNPDTAATLEATLIGPEIAFDREVVCAVAGATFDLRLDGRPVEMNRMLEARPGSVLKFGERQVGARTYVAVAGGIDVPLVLGSRSTHVLTRMGGLDGRPIRRGDRLRIGPAPALTKSEKIGSDPISLPRGGARVRVIPADERLFDAIAAERFRVSTHSDRMGYRLEYVGRSGFSRTPPGSRTPSAGELISRAVPTGAIQVPPTGDPILLMADHATTGGYAVAGTVITADLPVAAQLAPGDWIEFQTCTLEDADRALASLEASIARG